MSTIKVGKATYTPDKLDAFTKDLVAQLGADAALIKESLLSEITGDLSREEVSFAGWPEAIREVSVRNVGYQAEATLRKLMVQNAERHRSQKEAAERNIERATRDWTADQGKLATERRFQTQGDWTDYCKAQRASITEGVIGYCKASYMTAYSADWRTRELFRWVTGEEDREPLHMNCWEGVLFGLVKSGLVDRTYVGWCNGPGQRERYEGRKGDKLFVSLFQHLIDDMDCYWGTPDAAFGAHKAKQMPSQDGFKPLEYPAFLVPEDFIIPRGRVLMFTAGAHMAISTGKRVRIESATVRDFFKIDWGHGMIELDGGYADGSDGTYSFREGTIEDLYIDRRQYLGNLVVAPFPRCAEPGTIVLKGVPRAKVADEPDFAEAKREYLEKHREEIQQERSDALAKRDARIQQIAKRQKELQEDAAKGPDDPEYARLEEELATARTNADKQLKLIDSKWDQKAEREKEIKRRRQEAEKRVKLPETITFRYNANDPYRPGRG